MTTFTATLEPLDESLIKPSYKGLIEKLVTGTMLVLTFPIGTKTAEIHQAREGLLVASMRLQGYGKIKSHMKETTLYVWLKEDHDRISALNAIQLNVKEKVMA